METWASLQKRIAQMGSDKCQGKPLVAEWRQEDPSVVPAGDVYGGGSPAELLCMKTELWKIVSADM